MALGHWWTNTGKYKLATTNFNGATNLYMGLLATASDGGAPTGADTEAEIQDLATVTALLAITSVDEPNPVGSYARQQLTSVTAVQDDTNNRVNMDAANATFSAVPATQYIWGGFISQGTGVDGDALISVFVIKDSGSGTSVACNGSDITATITDFARLS